MVSKTLVKTVAGKTYHAVAHVSLASCTDPVYPVFQVCPVDHNAVGFDDDSGLDLKRRFKQGFNKKN